MADINTKNLAKDIANELNKSGRNFNNNEELTKTQKIVDQIVSSLGDFDDALEEINNELFENNDEVRKLNKELGTGSKTVADFRFELSQLAKTAGLSTKAQINLLDTTKKYHQGLNSTTESTLKFIKASGAEASEIGKLSAKLKILGDISDESLNGMYLNILHVRDAYGLTDDQVNTVSDTLLKLATITGLNSDRMAQAAENVAIFTSKLAGAGIEADQVSEIMDKIIDPDKMMNNLMLLTKMGYTVSDLTIGDPTEKLAQSLPELKRIGQEITSQQNRIVANEMAKVYGITLETAREFAEIDTSETALNRSKTLENYRSEMMTFKENIQAVGTMLGGIASNLLNPILSLFQPFMNVFGDLMRNAAVSIVVIRKLFISAKNFISGLFGRASNAGKKFGDSAGNSFKEALNDVLKEINKKLGLKESDKAEILSRKISASEESDIENLLGKKYAKYYNKANKRHAENNGFNEYDDYDTLRTSLEEINKVSEKEQAMTRIAAKITADESRYGSVSPEAKDLRDALIERANKMAKAREELSRNYNIIMSENIRGNFNKGERFGEDIIKRYNENKGFNEADKSGLLLSMQKTFGRNTSNYLAGLSDEELYNILIDENGNFNNVDKVKTSINKNISKSKIDEEGKSGKVLEEAIETNSNLEKIRETINSETSFLNLRGNKEDAAKNIEVYEAELKNLESENIEIKDFNKKTGSTLNSFKEKTTGFGPKLLGLVKGIGIPSIVTSAILGIGSHVFNVWKETEGGKEAMKNLNDTITKMKETVNNILGKWLLPVVDKVSVWLNKGLDKVNGYLSKIETNTSDYKIDQLQELSYTTWELYSVGKMFKKFDEMTTYLKNTADSTAKTAENSEISLGAPVITTTPTTSN